MRILLYNDVMSGPLRRLIGPAKGRVQRYIGEASSILSSPIEERTIDDLEVQVEETIRHVNTNISLSERCNCNWASLLKDLGGDEKVKEEQELERVAEGGEGYIEVLLDAGDVVA